MGGRWVTGYIIDEENINYIVCCNPTAAETVSVSHSAHLCKKAQELNIILKKKMVMKSLVTLAGFFQGQM